MSPSWISLHALQKVVRSHSFDFVALLKKSWLMSDLPIGAEDDNTNVVSFQVESHTLDSRLELNHLTGLDLGETEDSGDTITNGDDRSELFQVVLHRHKNSTCEHCGGDVGLERVEH